ncbi:hypothetical protein LTR62_005274 [Meristemomyces frigidus]|uniref:Urease accessory protein UreF n=1 Tax=Meristemomyces frigidus TaxID=1508187 RepID=A0AAN7YJH6_9PEZI|nr:hypothetical protein LTR62_005274 [Meristemomyces frigidus]
MSTALNLHALLLLSDSALPLGSFAFSSGLESYLAHTKSSSSNKHFPAATTNSSKAAAFEVFLEQSISNVASTAIPYLLNAYHHPSYENLGALDNDFDASTPCTVARRASITQGRALLMVWERALRPTSQSQSADSGGRKASEALSTFATALKISKPDAHGLGLNGHFAPLFGLVCRALGLSEAEASYVFLLSHSKTVLSAAVRASVLGPYQSQAILAGTKLQGWLKGYVAREGRDEGCMRGGVEEAAVTIPVMDLWMGRHELLYSRIFNS